ncbi:hypothetical protein FBQ97_12635 [Acidobacteria bacterium ACD]|nr:hypothetical protein [Acidobacteria bacterium ACD]
MDRSLPFEFLDHKLRAGNSLVGCWFDRYRDYPLLAWEREGGDEKHDGVHHRKSVASARGRGAGKEKTTGNVWGAAIKEACARAKADLGDLLDGQQGLFDTVTGPDPAALHDEAVAAFDALHALPPHDPDGVAELYREKVLLSPQLAALREAFDAWCARWFWPADRLDLAPLPSTFDRLAAEARAVVAEVAARERFFHWELEFPDVFARPGSGFDAILGNPPWDTVQPNSKEFFSALDPLYRAYGKQEALRRQREIFEANAADEEAWLGYNGRFKASASFAANAAAPFGDPAQGEGVSLHRSASRSAERHGEWRSRRGKVKGRTPTSSSSSRPTPSFAPAAVSASSSPRASTRTRAPSRSGGCSSSGAGGRTSTPSRTSVSSSRRFTTASRSSRSASRRGARRRPS